MVNKLTVVLLISLLVCCGSAFALLDDNSTNLNQGQSQGQIGVNDNDNLNTQGQSQGQIGINENDNRNTNFNASSNSNSNRNNQSQGQGQGQLQGQSMDQGQAMLQGQGQLGEVNTTVDEHNKAYAYGAPHTVAQSGQQAAGVYSIFGGINFAQTEEARACMDKIDVIVQLAKNGFLTCDEAKAEALAQWNQLKDSTKSKRLLGILWKTRGCHLLNGLGLLSWDDMFSKMSLSQSSEQQEKARVDTDLTEGNRGYLK
jgi:hypothetical protein